jgi:hypothetical protein
MVMECAVFGLITFMFGIYVGTHLGPQKRERIDFTKIRPSFAEAQIHAKTEKYLGERIKGINNLNIPDTC